MYAAPAKLSPDGLSMVADLAGRLASGGVLALTGAGCSTESGIPDYRGPGTAQRARNPIQYRAFISDPRARQRYWARSMVGWPRIEAARPNAGHRALAELEGLGLLGGLITQNVDRLHHAAGNRNVVELHGALADVICLRCRAIEARADLQLRLDALNPHRVDALELAPDGDAEVLDLADFRVPDCLRCAGTLKPHVVFFGENVPRDIVDRAFAAVDAARTLLVLGTSLTVYSGLRFVRRASELGIGVAICNIGPTRGDEYATIRIDGACGEILPALVDAVRNRGGVN